MTIGASHGERGHPGDRRDVALERALLARYRARRAEWEKRPQVNDPGPSGKAARSQISRLTGLIRACEERIAELERGARVVPRQGG